MCSDDVNVADKKFKDDAECDVSDAVAETPTS